MSLFFITFEAIAILLAIGVIGFIVISKNVLPLKALDVLAPLIIDISIPALIFVNILTKFNPEKFTGWYTRPLWWIGYTILILLFTLIIGKFIKVPEFQLGLLYPNSIFIPLAIIPVIFPSTSNMLVELFIFTILSPVFVFNSYFYFFKQKGSFNWKKLFNPIFISTILSIFLVLVGLDGYIPNIVIKVSKMLGVLALPLIMILIGGNIYVDFKRRGKIKLKLLLLFLLLRNIIFPIIILILLYFIKPETNIAFLIFLMTIVPPLTAIPIIVERAKGDTSIANQFVVSSLIISIVTIPTWLAIFNKFFDFL